MSDQIHTTKRGCAACDRGDYQLGHADWCPERGKDHSGTPDNRITEEHTGKTLLLHTKSGFQEAIFHAKVLRTSLSGYAELRRDGGKDFWINRNLYEVIEVLEDLDPVPDPRQPADPLMEAAEAQARSTWGGVLQKIKDIGKPKPVCPLCYDSKVWLAPGAFYPIPTVCPCVSMEVERRKPVKPPVLRCYCGSFDVWKVLDLRFTVCCGCKTVWETPPPPAPVGYPKGVCPNCKEPGLQKVEDGLACDLCLKTW